MNDPDLIKQTHSQTIAETKLLFIIVQNVHRLNDNAYLTSHILRHSSSRHTLRHFRLTLHLATGVSIVLWPDGPLLYYCQVLFTVLKIILE